VLSFVSKRPILINRARPLLPSEAYWPEVRSALVIPIRAQERPMGVLRLEATRRFTFDDEDVKVFSILESRSPRHRAGAGRSRRCAASRPT